MVEKERHCIDRFRHMQLEGEKGHHIFNAFGSTIC